MWIRSSKKNSKSGTKELTSAQQVFDCALNLLSYHDYSERRMCERLREKGADAELIKEAILKLKDYGFINEERYAERVYAAWLRKQAYGRQHLLAELSKKGVRQDCLEQVLAQFTPELERENAQYAAEIFLQRCKNKLTGENFDYKKAYAAAGRFLAARGFGAGYIQLLLDSLQNVEKK